MPYTACKQNRRTFLYVCGWGGWALSMDPAEHVEQRRLRKAVLAYSKCLQDYPVLTKALTAYVAA